MDMSMFRTSICPLVVTKGAGQQVITTRFQSRDDPSVTRQGTHPPLASPCSRLRVTFIVDSSQGKLG
jgi:hypothetical protein